MIIRTEEAQCELCLASAPHEVVATGWDFEYDTTREEFVFANCLGCGLFFLKNRPAPDAMSVIYPNNYYSYDESSHENPAVKCVRDWLENRKASNLRRWIQGADNIRVVDIGCGDGRLLDILAKNAPEWEYHGIEINEMAAKRASQKGYSTRVCDFEFSDVSSFKSMFDFVLMHQVLEHTRSPRMVIRKVHEMLKPGGIFSIETPDTDAWDRNLFQRRYWGGYHIPRHFYLFNKKNIARILGQEGFEVISIRSILSPVFWILTVHNYLFELGYEKCSKLFNYQNPVLLAITTIMELVQTKIFGSSSNMQVIARKKN